MPSTQHEFDLVKKQDLQKTLNITIYGTHLMTK